MKNTLLTTLALLIALSFTALALTGCPGEPGPNHTHEWEWKVTTPATTTAEGLETETCKTCGAINGTRPIEKPVQQLENTVSLTGENLVGGALTPAFQGNTGVGTPTVTITGARDDTDGVYEITFDDVGQKIKVVAVYSNGSIEYTMPNAVPSPTMTVELTGDEDAVIADETTLTMTATVGNVAAGFNTGVSRSWKAGDAVIPGATGDTLAVTGDHAGQTITGTAWLTDYDIVRASAAAKHVVTVPIIPPVTKTQTVELRDGALTFDIKYEALPSVPVPGYVAYIQERLEALGASPSPQVIAAVDYLINNGGSEHTIIVEYTGSSYEELVWDPATRKFKFHHDWISTASGNDVSGATFMNAFYLVEVAMLNARDTIRMAKAPVDSRAIAQGVAALIPQSKRAIQQRVALELGGAWCLSLELPAVPCRLTEIQAA